MIHPIIYILWRKTWEHGEKPSEQGEKQQQLNPHMTSGRNWTWASLVEGERSQHYAIPVAIFFRLICGGSIFQPQFTAGQNFQKNVYCKSCATNTICFPRVNILHGKPHKFKCVVKPKPKNMKLLCPVTKDTDNPVSQPKLEVITYLCKAKCRKTCVSKLWLVLALLFTG